MVLVVVVVVVVVVVAVVAIVVVVVVFVFVEAEETGVACKPPEPRKIFAASKEALDVGLLSVRVAASRMKRMRHCKCVMVKLKIVIIIKSRF